MKVLKSMVHLIINILIVAIVPIYLEFSERKILRGLLVSLIYIAVIIGIRMNFIPACIIGSIYMGGTIVVALYLIMSVVKEQQELYKHEETLEEKLRKLGV